MILVRPRVLHIVKGFRTLESDLTAVYQIVFQAGLRNPQEDRSPAPRKKLWRAGKNRGPVERILRKVMGHRNADFGP